MKNKIWLFTLVILFISLVSTQVPSFHQFYGSVLDVNGSLVSVTVLITASINGSHVGSTSSDAGFYGYTDLFFVESLSGSQGSNITFTANGRFAQNYTFQEEEATHLNFTFNESAPLYCIDEDADTYSIEGGDCGPVDCDDNNAAASPGRSEACGDHIDNDCDGAVDEGCGGNGNGNGNGNDNGGTITFSLNTTEISLVIFQGETRQIRFRVADAGVGPATLHVTSDMNLISEGNFTLPRAGFVIVSLDVSVPEDMTPNAYVGHIYVEAKGIKKEILVGIEVTSRDALFDVALEIPEEYDYALPGEAIRVTFTLTKLIQESVEELDIEYTIKDENDEVILFEEETREVQDDEEIFTKEFIIPKGTPHGAYLLYSQIKYDDKTASASKWFNVGPRDIGATRWIVFLTIWLIIIIIIIVVIILVLRYKRLHPTQF